MRLLLICLLQVSVVVFGVYASQDDSPRNREMVEVWEREEKKAGDMERELLKSPATINGQILSKEGRIEQLEYWYAHGRQNRREIMIREIQEQKDRCCFCVIKPHYHGCGLLRRPGSNCICAFGDDECGYHGCTKTYSARLRSETWSCLIETLCWWRR